MPNPVTGRIGLGELPHSMFSRPGFAIQAADLDQGVITPDSLGMVARNQSGSSIPVGSLVYVSGWDATTNLPLLSLASAAAQNTKAQWVTLAAIANNTNGGIGRHYRLTGLNTGAAAQGDSVWLSTVAGGVSVTNPTATSLIYQLVGRVAVVSASIGAIDLDLLSGSSPATLYRANAGLAAIGTAAGPYVGYTRAELPGTIISATAVFPAGLAISGTNYIVVSAVNLVTGAGTNPLLAAGATINSTFTGGAAVVADTDYPLALSGTPANLVVGANNNLKVLVTVTGTLGSVIPDGSYVSFAITPS